VPAAQAALRILLVEDNEDHAFLARAALEEAGHHVHLPLRGSGISSELQRNTFMISL